MSEFKESLEKKKKKKTQMSWEIKLRNRMKVYR